MNFILAAGACALFTLLLLAAEAVGRERLKWIAKPAASVCFVLAAIAAGGPESGYGRLIMIGLIFCLIGDILLIPAAARTFILGVGAFAAGHLAYLAAFAADGAGLNSAGAAAGLAAAAASIALVRSLWEKLGPMRTPIIGYCAIISLMVAAAFAAAERLGGGYWIGAAGAAAFALSDISVAWDRFAAPSLANRLWGLPLYYAAQLMMAASIALV